VLLYFCFGLPLSGGVRGRKEQACIEHWVFR